MQQNWHHGYLLPVGWAIIIHLVFFACLLKPLAVLPPPEIVPISSYLYTPPNPVVSKDPLFDELAAVMPLEPNEIKTVTEVSSEASDAIAEQILSSPMDGKALAQAATEANTSVNVDIGLTAEPLTEPARSARLTERALSGIALQYSAPEADYAAWSQQQKQPRLTVAKQHQQPNDTTVNAARGVGMQMVKLGDRCLLVDPALSGFEQLMNARGVPCKESDDAVLYRQVMSKWLERE